MSEGPLTALKRFCLVALCGALLGHAGAAIPVHKIPNPQTGECAKELGHCMARAGDFLMVGAPETAVAGTQRVGGVWVYRRTGESDFEYVAQLLPENRAQYLGFGRSVAATSQTLVVGAPGSDGVINGGTAYVYEPNKLDEWELVEHLTPEQAGDWDGVGEAVAIAGDIMALGAPNDGQGGSVYIYTRRPSGEWQQTAQLRPSDPIYTAGFGCSLALDGTRLVVGASGAVGVEDDTGAAYVFSRVGEGLWNEEAKLYASDGDHYEKFGISVALLGNRVAVGTEEDDLGHYPGLSEAGSVYVFEYAAGSGWAERAKVRAYDSDKADDFGTGLFLTSTTLAVGAWGWDEVGFPDLGAVYLWRRDNATSWSQTARLICPSDGDTPEMGRSVMLWGDTVLAGAPGLAHPQERRGQILVFHRDGATSWTAGQGLEIPDPAAYDYFGHDVTLAGDLALIKSDAVGEWGATWVRQAVRLSDSDDYTSGQPMTPPDGAAFSTSLCFASAVHGEWAIVGDSAVSDFAAMCGATYAYRRGDDGEWEYKQRLLPTGPSYYDRFGWSVTVWGDVAAVGAPQSPLNQNRHCFVTVFRVDSDGVWQKEAQLGPPTSDEYDGFGWSVSLCGDTLAVGNRCAWSSGQLPACIFVRDGSNSWTLQQVIESPDPDHTTNQFSVVALRGDLLAVGDRYYTPSSTYTRCGRVFLFRRENEHWGLLDYLSPGLFSLDSFGESLAMSDEWLVVGAPGRDTAGGSTGAAYLYKIEGSGDWSLEAQLAPPDGKSGDAFGSAVAVSDTHCLVGALYHDANGTDAGTAYFCQLPTPTPSPPPKPTQVPTSTPTATPTEVPVIVEEPRDVHIPAGETARFYTEATGPGPMGFAWQRNREAVEMTSFLSVESEGWASTLTIERAHFDHPGLYRCVVTNAVGSTMSREALLTLGGPLIIAAQPRDVTVALGTSAEFRIGASGTRPLTYTWYHNGATIAANPSIAADTDTLTVFPVMWGDSGLYWCEVEGGYPSSTATSDPARLCLLPAGVEAWWELMR